MENSKAFFYRYSATENEEIRKIRERYLPKEESKLEKLKRLDQKVRSAGTLESLVLGVTGSLVFGIGMCFGLDVFAGADILTLIFMGLGTLIMLPAYPLYKRIAKKTRDSLTPEIIKLSDELMSEK